MAGIFKYIVLNNVSVFFFQYLMQNVRCTRAKDMNAKQIRNNRLGHTRMMQNLGGIVLSHQKRDYFQNLWKAVQIN